MSNDFTSASGTRKFRSGRPWSQGVKYTWMYATFTHLEDTAEAFEYFTLKTDYKTESETDFNIKIRATKVDVERIMHQLGIVEYTIVELNDE